MVKITNGVNLLEVTKGAYEAIYSKQGFRKIEDIPLEENENENDTADGEIVDIVEKPISKWTKEEIRLFAEENGIEMEESLPLKEKKEIVKEYIENM